MTADKNHRNQPSALLTAFATVFGQTTLVVATIVCGLASSILGWLPPRGNWTFWLGKVWSWLLLWSGLIRVRTRFAVPLDAAQSYVFLANHQSLYDIPALIASLPGQTRFLAKRSLFRIPIFGWALAAGGFVPVDRGDRKRARETFAVALERLRQGRSIAIFPEETRSLDGRLLPFKRGGILLALRSGFPIIPVAIRGTMAIQPKTSFVIRPGTAEVSFGAPIATEELTVRDRSALESQVRGAIEAMLDPASRDASAVPAAQVG